MKWIAVDADGTAYKYGEKPIRATDCWMPDHSDSKEPEFISLSEVCQLTGRDMKWSEEPFEIK